jgi:2-keto-myo-inositol isomerase
MSTGTPSALEPFGYCLNTSTIRGEKGLAIERSIDVAAQAGYTAMEPWIDELERFVAQGGVLAELRRRFADRGLTVAGAVGFAEWIVEDAAQRAAGLEHMRRDMEMVAAIGGRFIATPAIGAHKIGQHKPELKVIGERYRALLELGAKTGVTPILELWGFSQTLSTLGEVLHAAAEARDTRACVLLDSYHLYKGGSDFNAVRLVNGAVLPVFHINDYPASPPRAEIDDSDRVYPGDGVAPLKELMRTLQAIGFKGYLSVELFNTSYWQLPPDVVAKTALEKTRAVVRSAFAG